MVCAGQGGNDLLGNRQQNGEQQLRLGNLALVSLLSTVVAIMVIVIIVILALLPWVLSSLFSAYSDHHH